MTARALDHDVWRTLCKLKDEPTDASLAGSTGGGNGDTAASASRKESVSTISVSAAELLSDFDGNTIYANTRYNGNTVRVEGFVETVTVENGEPYVYLSSERRPAFRYVVCSFDNSDNADLAQLRKHSRITVRGDCKGRGHHEGILLDNCQLIKEVP